MIVVASANGRTGIYAAIDILRGGGSALDAVEAATRIVEADPDDHTVGYGGYPNLLGEVELDASIMDGRTLAAGAVGGLKGFKHAISVARRVMEELPHVLLAGEGAARFAREIGMDEAAMLTPEAESVYRMGLQGRVPEAQRAWLTEGIERNLSRLVKLTADPEHAEGTVNFIAQDRNGNIASAVSTSGWAWKYPGRLGDSPLIGAGNYADNRYGACTCTGWGELAIRLATSRSVVLYQRLGFGLAQAGRQALEDLQAARHKMQDSSMNLVAIDHAGVPIGMSTATGRTYIWMTPEMTELVEDERVVVDLGALEGPGETKVP